MKNGNENARQALKEIGNLVGLTSVKPAETGVADAPASAEPPFSPVAFSAPVTSPSGEKSTTSFLSEGMYLEGSLVSSGDFELHGEIQGNIESEGSITITGKVVGNIKAKGNLNLLGASVQGDIEIKGTIFVDRNTVIIGNAGAKSINLDGRMKGSIQVEEMAVLKSNAILVGDVRADKTIMNEGALMHGSVVVSEGKIQPNLFEKVTLRCPAGKPAKA